MPALDGSAGEFRRFFRREVPVGGGSVVKVRYGAGNAQDAVEGARTHVETRHALAKLLKAFVIGPRVLAEQTRSYLCIAIDSFLILVAGFLNGTRLRISADGSAGCVEAMSSKSTGSISHWMSIRSSRGPEILFMYFDTAPGGQVQGLEG